MAQCERKTVFWCRYAEISMSQIMKLVFALHLHFTCREIMKDDAQGFSLLLQFVMAVMDRWPHAVLQFEDFNLEHAEPLLQVQARPPIHYLIINCQLLVEICQSFQNYKRHGQRPEQCMPRNLML